MGSEVTTELVKLGALAVAGLLSLALNAIRKKWNLDAEGSKVGAATVLAGDVLSDLLLFMAPEVALKLADGKIDEAEADDLWAKMKAHLGETGLAKLEAWTGHDLDGLKKWLLTKLGAKAVSAKTVGLGPFFMSPEMAKRQQETK